MADAMDASPPVAPAHAPCHQWLVLAVGSLVIAGLLSLTLLVGRLPILATLELDAAFFKRGLVVHVVLALVVWLAAFLAAMHYALGARAQSRLTERLAAAATGVGIVTMTGSAFMTRGQPILANYVPVIDHPVFLGGLALVLFGVAVSLLDARLVPTRDEGLGLLRMPPATRVLLRSAVLAWLLALLTFGASILVTPETLAPAAYFELVAWGGGHVLQSASVALMLSIWVFLVSHVIGRPALPRADAVAVSVVLVGPLLAGPAIALSGTAEPLYANSFTTIMRWTTWPPTLWVLARLVAAYRRDGPAPSASRAPLLAFATSALLAVTGFVLGAMIRGADTRIPAHYHASIGAVSAACMAMTWPLLRALGRSLRNDRVERLVALQPAVFGAGQWIFAIGFGVAGAYGMLRKTYGAEQVVPTLAAKLGLFVMVAGGVIAVLAGVFFLVVFTMVALRRTRAPEPLSTHGAPAWKVRNIHSNA